MPLTLPKISRTGTTPSRKRFWDNARETLLGLQKVAGRNVTVDEHKGKGTFINVNRPPSTAVTGACCVGTDCSITTEADCTEAGGTWQGPWTLCTPNPCGGGGGCPEPGCPPISVSASVIFSVDDTESFGCGFHASHSETLDCGTVDDICAAGGAWGPFDFTYPEYDNGQIFINSISAGVTGTQACLGTDGVCGVFYDCDEFGTCCGSGYFCFYIDDAYMTEGTSCADGCGTSTTFIWSNDDGMGFTISAHLTISVS